MGSRHPFLTAVGSVVVVELIGPIVNGATAADHYAEAIVCSLNPWDLHSNPDPRMNIRR